MILFSSIHSVNLFLISLLGRVTEDMQQLDDDADEYDEDPLGDNAPIELQYMVAESEAEPELLTGGTSSPSVDDPHSWHKTGSVAADNGGRGRKLLHSSIDGLHTACASMSSAASRLLGSSKRDASTSSESTLSLASRGRKSRRRTMRDHDGAKSRSLSNLFVSVLSPLRARTSAAGSDNSRDEVSIPLTD